MFLSPIYAAQKPTLHLFLIEPVGDVPDVENGGSVLRLLGFLLLPQPLLRTSFHRLKQAQSSTSGSVQNSGLL
jgi:hypothetical protein